MSGQTIGYGIGAVFSIGVGAWALGGNVEAALRFMGFLASVALAIVCLSEVFARWY